jgi:DNA replication and repair protein RecF
MKIQKLRLSNFRNFKSELFEFSPEVTIIIGPNASGKTNVLESLYLLSTGKSFHAKIEEEMISYTADISRIKGQVLSSKGEKEEKTILESVLTRGMLDIGNGRPERVSRKKLFINGVARRLIDFAGNFRVVLFGPWDLDLVTESPSLRRKFLDSVLSQIDREYRRATLSYEKGLRQRNKLLLRIRDENLSRSQLLFWNQLLIKNGDYISLARQNFIDFANKTEALNDQKFSLEYDKSPISEGRLEQYAEEEVAAATTLVGPHRDDFVVKITNAKKINAKLRAARLPAGRDLARFGSRGEQRMAVLWLKLAELEFIEEKTSERPTLLLDDIFSELDHQHRGVVMKIIKEQTQFRQGSAGQAIITTADPHFVKNFKKVEKIKLEG